MSAIDFERVLNPDQLAAVTHEGSPQLVLAGAGSGKTRVITHRIAWLADERGVDPATIVAVTFTNKAAGEMRDRAERLLARWPLPAFVGTFHRFALVMLRRYGDRLGLQRDFAILDDADQRALVTQAMAAERIPESAFPPRAILSAISAAKNRLETPEQFEKHAHDVFEQRVARVYRRYDALCRKVSGVDFDDLLALAVRLLADAPEAAARVRARCRVLLVDEFQDTNHAQLRLVTSLIGHGQEAGDLTAVGDEDQGIYRWRGADLSNVLEFERHFPSATIRKLERNYRSTATILDAANAVVAKNRLRRGKRLWTDAGRGEPVRLLRMGDEVEEAKRIVEEIGRLRSRFELADLAVLVRTNAQTRAFEDEFFQSRIPYTLVGGVRFYERAEIKDLIAYLRALRNPRDNVSLLRILNQPPRGIGKTTIAMVEERAAEETGGVVWDLLDLDRLDRFPSRAATALRSFRDLLRELSAAGKELPLPALLDELLAKTHYLDIYRRDSEEDQAKLENLREFLTAAQSFTDSRSVTASRRDASPSADEDDDLLTGFLDHVALVSDLDGWEVERGVTLMTLHAAKGLEFPVVFLGGLEEGLLPHFNSQGTPENLEEERRLFYVGMTRAGKRLYLSACRRRRIAGRYQDQRESPFLGEVPTELLEVEESPSLYAHERARPIDQFFGRAERASYAPESPAKGPRRGARVRHPTLGPGVVLEIEGDGDEAKLTVFFERAGKKRLVARYAALEPA